MHSAQRRLLLWLMVTSPDKKMKTGEAEASQKKDMKGNVEPKL